MLKIMVLLASCLVLLPGGEMQRPPYAPRPWPDYYTSPEPDNGTTTRRPVTSAPRPPPTSAPRPPPTSAPRPPPNPALSTQAPGGLVDRFGSTNGTIVFRYFNNVPIQGPESPCVGCLYRLTEVGFIRVSNPPT